MHTLFIRLFAEDFHRKTAGFLVATVLFDERPDRRFHLTKRHGSHSPKICRHTFPCAQRSSSRSVVSSQTFLFPVRWLWSPCSSLTRNGSAVKVVRKTLGSLGILKIATHRQITVNQCDLQKNTADTETAVEFDSVQKPITGEAPQNRDSLTLDSVARLQLIFSVSSEETTTFGKAPLSGRTSVSRRCAR